MRLALAALKVANSISHGVEKITCVLKDARRQKVDIVCFPETYLPGLRGVVDSLPPPNQESIDEALREIRGTCRANGVAAIVGIEWISELGLENRALVISRSGRLIGYQTKNQITPNAEDKYYVPDGMRRVFRLQGTVFGIVICHEGFRYPETARWAALRGARIIFQPQWTGSDETKEEFPSGPSALTHFERTRGGKQVRGGSLKRWGDAYYEKAMVCRAQENSVYFASVNPAMKYQNSATSLIDPRGHLMGFVPYGKEDVLIADIDPGKATRFYARKFKPELYPD
jgi:predicted amidohydrolase